MCVFSKIVALGACSTLAAAWLPKTNKEITASDGTNLFLASKGKIRGVNLGSQFIFEPWIGENAWNDMGCDAANIAFPKHWASWITQDDITEMVSYGLNTIRVPVGYWLREVLVYSDSEHFPQGGLDYVKNLCGWASDAGMYIIRDLRAAPEAQTPRNAFTGQMAPEAGFYRIRANEASAGIDKNDYLHIQMMDKLWGSGDPNQYLDDLYYAAYDDHRYLKWDTSVDVSHGSYIRESCNDNRDSNNPTIVGEWSLALPDNVQSTSDWNPSSNMDFYKKWFAAQVHSY
ncbi:glucan endo-1-6-beta-glucosidase B [Penicillium daleae]|uniref:glucan endo-1,6-beta-glucosidase n=1 Tax=Penicillium daleae TaxID=63821 RepID=A0AAD6BWR7_9EURO|nr:glucan endo-1-6-beta-glucosidase B [Penicillium daleae]KAJ5438020.1 glucan endo-1-6-beta-glucosidase B [Penicillium daleae]